MFLEAVKFPLENSTIPLIHSLNEYLLIFPELTEYWLNDGTNQKMPLFEFCRRGFERQRKCSTSLNMRQIMQELEVLNQCLGTLIIMGNLSPIALKWLPTLFSEALEMIQQEYQSSLQLLTSSSINMFTMRCKTLCEITNLISREEILEVLKSMLVKHCLRPMLDFHIQLDDEEKKQMSYTLLVHFINAVVSDEFQLSVRNTAIESTASYNNAPKKELVSILFADSELVNQLICTVQRDLVSCDRTTKLQALYFLNSMIRFKHEAIISSLFLDHKEKPEEIKLDDIIQWRKSFFLNDGYVKQSTFLSFRKLASQWYDWKLGNDSIISGLFGLLSGCSDEEAVYQVYSLLLELSRFVQGRITDLWAQNGKMISLMEILSSAGKNDKICTDFITEMYCVIRSCAISEYIMYQYV
ncbi:uncharacterized protein Ecym_1016 [Eremothecium cymbalariae DBVPG|uniref:Uncharacterized protein n=1 Tax=Eremothecium cymbalariae (strain CBS 270.75 / DBVPG 7215 / KCTC 17166 / NRRL Y-17582) TaxID=931890 RepID=G8JM15_ERECY|nr:hypothetical protein Ecym_1016 [Eremothecium cymbalariae DBVPG\